MTLRWCKRVIAHEVSFSEQLEASVHTHNTHAHSNYILGHSIIYFCNFLQKVIDKLYDLHYCQLIMSHLWWNLYNLRAHVNNMVLIRLIMRLYTQFVTIVSESTMPVAGRNGATLWSHSKLWWNDLHGFVSKPHWAAEWSQPSQLPYTQRWPSLLISLASSKKSKVIPKNKNLINLLPSWYWKADLKRYGKIRGLNLVASEEYIERTIHIDPNVKDTILN